jgi:hypothetical protein
VEGLKNRVSIAVQQALKMHDRTTIRDIPALIAEVQAALVPIVAQWGVNVVEFGFSNISPSQATLEVTQMSLLAAEKQRLFRRFVDEDGLRPDEAVALISGAVVAMPSEKHGQV